MRNCGLLFVCFLNASFVPFSLQISFCSGYVHGGKMNSSFSSKCSWGDLKIISTISLNFPFSVVISFQSCFPDLWPSLLSLAVFPPVIPQLFSCGFVLLSGEELLHGHSEFIFIFPLWCLLCLSFHDHNIISCSDWEWFISAWTDNKPTEPLRTRKRSPRKPG